MFQLAHLSDPHIGPIRRPRVVDLMNKRITGYANWRRGRKSSHNMDILAALIADIHASQPDHIACTGDIANIGLPSEWPAARAFLKNLGSPDQVSFVPGNHDAYVPGALEGLLRECAPWIEGDLPSALPFPYLRRRGPIALIGLSSAIPTLPFIASGALHHRQISDAEALLKQCAEEKLCRVVMIHHAPHKEGSKSGRGLMDASAFESMIARIGAELILHGHNHVTSVTMLKGPQRPVPTIGVPSASSRGGAIVHRAAWHLFKIEPVEDRFEITGETRGLLIDGSIGPIAPLSLDGPGHPYRALRA